MSFAFTIARRACAAPRVLGSVSTIRYLGATAGDEKGAKKKKKMTKKELLLEANEKRVYLLDGTAMLYRAHFAGQALLNSAQEKPPVLANLTSHFSKFVHNINPKYVAVVFDHGKRTFRNELFPGYKKQRTEVLSAAKLDAYNILNLCNLRTCRRPRRWQMRSAARRAYSRILARRATL